ncbi:DNA topoisomerase 2 [Entophlyctis luteolus]|nr:DNA topoisomerase 2 [Entophlyctis luteolus]
MDLGNAKQKEEKKKQQIKMRSSDSDNDRFSESEINSESDESVQDFVDDNLNERGRKKPASKPKATNSKKLPASKSAKAAKEKPAPQKKPDSDHSLSPETVSADAVPAASVAQPKSKKTVEEIYQKKTQLEHILLRPDTYIGSIESFQAQMWVMDNEASKKLTLRNINYVPGLYKIFDEILVNAADNKIRDPSMDTIKVVVDRENTLISIYNNGRGIPIEIHSKEGVYVPELIFGHLLTSSNYDDSEKKVTGGRNGYGAKLCNIFSVEFVVETGDSSTGTKYKQKFSNNMSKKDPPKITSAKTEDFTKITFKPDLAKFGMTHLDDDITALFKKRAYDLAGCVPGVKVFLNDTRIKVKNFKEYIDLFGPGTEDGEMKKLGQTVIYERFSPRWEVAFTVSDGQFQQVSFVNGICTSKGGTHVNHVADQLVNALAELAKKKDKKGNAKESIVKPHLVKSQLSIFVNCLIENPAFDSQTKENMTLKSSSFGSKCNLSEEFLKKVAKSGVIESILAVAKFKSDQALKKTDGGKRTRISGIAKLDDANNAGTRSGSQCTLILTEGDSAKSLAVSGLGVVGRDYYGVFPLRGKLLNVREAASSQILNNAEITYLKQIIGLKQGKKYENTNDLRYGHIMIMTDQDHDGSHIKGLIINLLDCFWPSLLKIPGFLLEFVTPIVKVTPKGKNPRKQEISFFNIPEYEKWKKSNDDGKGFIIKYYKGLGTSTTEDAKQYFSEMDHHRKSFRPLEPEDTMLVDMAFNKKKADDRKEWLRQFQPGTYMDHSINEIPISDFINKELILFSMADNLRSIPSCVDGLKPGHRKILYCCFKRNLRAEIKVTQLAGYVAEHSAYHHGEASLFATMIGMAQNFIGSNNLNLLEPRGQFGTRLQGGKDSASPRYIFTSLNPLARILFHPEDDALLNYLNDDGLDIEPEWYIPILPMLLVNGADGIGTGWSTSVPNYNPRDIVDNLFRLMDGEDLKPMKPWYRGFTGTIEPTEKGGFKVSGTIMKTSSTTVDITELPIKVWTQSYKEQLEAWMAGDEAKKISPWIKDYKEYHTDARVHFSISLSEQAMKAAEEEGLEKKFKLTSQISTSNIVCFDLEGRICKYETVEHLLSSFYTLRLKYYIKRKEAMLAKLTFEWTKLDNKVRFIQEIITGKLVIQNRKRAEIVRDLVARDYFRVPKTKSEKASELQEGDLVNDGDESAESDNKGAASDFDYLLTMPLWTLSFEKIEQLAKERKQKQNEITELTGKSPTMLWKMDLDEFLVHWDNYEQEMSMIESSRIARKGKGGAIKIKRPPAKKKNYEDDDYDSDAADKGKIKHEAKPKPLPKAAEKTDVVKTKAEVIAERPKADPIKKDPESKVDAGKQLPAWMTGSSPLPAVKVFHPPQDKFVISDDSSDHDGIEKLSAQPKKPIATKGVKDEFTSEDSDRSDSHNKPRANKTVARAKKTIESDSRSDSEENFEFQEKKKAAMVRSVPSMILLLKIRAIQQTKKRQLGGQKAVLPGRAFKPVSHKTAIEIDISDSENEATAVKAAVGSAPMTELSGNANRISPGKRSKGVSDDSSDSEHAVAHQEKHKPFRSRVAAGRKPTYVVESDGEDDDGGGESEAYSDRDESDD